MPVPYETLRNTLQRLLAGTATPGEVTELVHVSRSIVQSYLESSRSSVAWLSHEHGLSLQDLAYDCLGEAFLRDDMGLFLVLERFSHALAPPLPTIPDLNLFLAYKGFLVKVAEQQLARMYAQLDPTGGKIHHNIRGAVKKSHLLILGRDLRGLVIQPERCDALDARPVFPAGELERALSNSVGKHRKTGDLLKILHDVLTQQSEYRRSIPLAEVARMFKNLFGRDLENESGDGSTVNEGVSAFEIERISRQVEIAVKQKILLTYVAKGKLRPKETEAVCSAFHDLIADLRQSDGMQEGLVGYLRRYLDISDTQYENKFRSKMEYLFKIAREEFAARCMNEL